MNIMNPKEEPGLKKRTTKYAMIAGTAIIASTLFAGTALASSTPINGSSDNQFGKHQFMLSLKNGSDDPINLSGSSPEMIKEQVKSLVESGKLTAQEAEKILAFDNHSKDLSDSSQDKLFISGDPDSKPLEGKQLKLMIKNESGQPIELSGSSPEMIKEQVEALVKSGKLTAQEAEKILSAGNHLSESNDSAQVKGFFSKDLDSKPLEGKQMKILFKNGSGEPIELSGSTPEMIKSQLQSLLNEGKITQQTADKIINSLMKLPTKET